MCEWDIISSGNFLFYFVILLCFVSLLFAGDVFHEWGVKWEEVHVCSPEDVRDMCGVSVDVRRGEECVPMQQQSVSLVY